MRIRDTWQDQVAGSTLAWILLAVFFSLLGLAGCKTYQTVTVEVDRNGRPCASVGVPCDYSELGCCPGLICRPTEPPTCGIAPTPTPSPSPSPSPTATP